MNSKERVMQTLNHMKTDRPPIAYMILVPEVANKICEIFGLKDYEDAVEYLGIDYRKLKIPFISNPSPHLKEIYEKTYSREWPITNVTKPYFAMPTFGIEDSASYSNSNKKRVFEQIESIAQIEAFSWPDPNWLDYDALDPEIERHINKAIIAPDWSPIFGSVCEFFGMETALMNLMLNPELIEATIEKITDYYFARNQILFEKYKNKIDIFMIGDDFASQTGLMINLDTWKKFFKKPLSRLINQAKSYGLKVHEHCCGAMSELIPEFIELGIDELEPCQFHLPGMNPDRLNRDFAKHITFFGGVNTQKTLPYGSPEDVRHEVRKNIRAFSNGGYAVGSDHTMLIEFPIENILALYDEARIV